MKRYAALIIEKKWAVKVVPEAKAFKRKWGVNQNAEREGGNV